jgi:hypothetical protein
MRVGVPDMALQASAAGRNAFADRLNGPLSYVPVFVNIVSACLAHSSFYWRFEQFVEIHYAPLTRWSFAIAVVLVSDV